MDIQELISRFRGHLEDLQTALDKSALSQDKEACFSIEDWLQVAIATYAETSGRAMDADSSTQGNSIEYLAFNEIVDSALRAMENGDSAEAFCNESYSGEQSLSDKEILALAKRFCKENGSSWEAVSKAIQSGNVDGLQKELAAFVAVLTDRKDSIQFMLEETTQSSGVDSLLIPWYPAILAAFCSTKAAVKCFIDKEIGKYFDRWHIGDSEERFPYALKGDNYLKYRSMSTAKGGVKEIWEDGHLEANLCAFEKNFFNLQNTARYVIHNNAFCQVNNGGYELIDKGKYGGASGGRLVKLSKTNTYLDMFKIPAWFIKEGDEYRETFDLQIYQAHNEDCNSRYGKGSPELMNYVVEEMRLAGYRIDKEFLRKCMLGIDCSGFVTRAIVYVMIELQIPVATQLLTLGNGYGRIKTNATTLRSKGRKVLFWYSYVSPDKKHFEKELIKDEPTKDYHLVFQPGDIIMEKKVNVNTNEIQDDGFHIWIIKAVSKDSIEILNSRALDSVGPISDIYHSLSEFVTTVKLKETTSEDGTETYRSRLEFARPMIFSDLSNLSKYYINYLSRVEV